MGKFGIVQTVEDNRKLFSKQQIAVVVWARDLYEKLIYPSTSDFRAIVSVGGVPGSRGEICEWIPKTGGGVKHYSPGEIMMDRRLNANNLQ